MAPWALFLGLKQDRLITAIIVLAAGIIASYIGTNLAPGRQVGLEMFLAVSIIAGGINLAVLILIFAIVSAIGASSRRGAGNR
jgi:hypothetical protein